MLEPRRAMTSPSNSPWTPELDAAVTRGWHDGLSTRAIGVSIGMSKNAVIGRASRLGLPPRPSPIKNLPEVLAAKASRHGIARRDILAARAKARHEANVELARVQQRHAFLSETRKGKYKALQCQYITNDVAPFAFCNVKTDGTVYCADHAVLCYMRVIPVLGRVS